MPQGGEALHRNSIITFSSLARRLEAQTAAVASSCRSSLRAAPRSSLRPPPPAGLCLLHRTDAFCRQASALKETQATFLSPESLQWTEPLKQEQSPSFPASQSRACALFLCFFLKLKSLTWCEAWANKQAGVCREALSESLATVFHCCCLWRCLWCFLYSLSSAISILGTGSKSNSIVMIIFGDTPINFTILRQCEHWGGYDCLWCLPAGRQKAEPGATLRRWLIPGLYFQFQLSMCLK